MGFFFLFKKKEKKKKKSHLNGFRKVCAATTNNNHVWGEIRQEARDLHLSAYSDRLPIGFDMSL